MHARALSDRGRPTPGFTLLEVLVALTIVALIAATAVPALATAIDRERFKACARELADALKTARYNALAKQSEATLTLDVEAQTYRLDDGHDRQLAAPRRTTIALVTATTEQAGASSGAIRFFADGSSTGGTVTIELQDRRRLVVVDWLTGRVEVRAP